MLAWSTQPNPTQPNHLNLANRTLAITDNLPFLRSLNNECIDLIAIDPPFAANETFTQKPRPPITPAELAEEKALAKKHGAQHKDGVGETKVEDVWSWDKDVHPAWKMRIADDYPPIHAVIQAVEACASENEAAYIAFMAVRLIECRRVLKPTGSIYVHCDDHANSYLRMLMDAVFGRGNFRNEIVWCYDTAGRTQRYWNRKHDTILFYSKGMGWQFTPLRVPRRNLTDDWLSWYSQIDADGRRFQIDGKGYKYYADEGRLANDWWDDLPALHAHRDSERTGYATQKPLALYERIINASSNPGDVVLDIFAGCATTAVAAERLGRQWIACDMAYRSWTMLKRRFLQNGWKLQDTSNASYEAMAQAKAHLPGARPKSIPTKTIGPKELPKRTDSDPAPFHNLTPKRGRIERSPQTASWSGTLPKDEARRLLIDRFGPVCWGCGYEPRRPNGTLDDTLLEVDHIRARRAAEGVQGDDELYNLALLHRTCNGIKRNTLTLEELRADNVKHGRLYVETVKGLVDLHEAQRFATQHLMHHAAQHGLQMKLDS